MSSSWAGGMLFSVIREKVGKTQANNAAEQLTEVIRKRPSATSSPSSPTVTDSVASRPRPTVSIRRKDAMIFEAAPAEHFTGSARVERLFEANAPARASGASVAFEPGARTAWHVHPLGQTLIVTGGTGWVQQWGEAPQIIREGDVVSIPPGIKHWHGAGATTAMTHIAVQEELEGNTVEWMERVSDTEPYPPL